MNVRDPGHRLVTIRHPGIGRCRLNPMDKQPNRAEMWLNRGFFSVPSPDGDRIAAARMFIGLAIPSLTLLLTGHPELVMYAVFGCFTGMYGRGEPHQLRLFHQFWPPCSSVPVYWQGSSFPRPRSGCGPSS